MLEAGAETRRGFELMRFHTSRAAAAALSTALLVTFLPGCSVNPATGKQQINLISEERAIAMGREADEQIVQQFGLYPSDELQSYMQELGSELAARSERPHLPWTFRVLDDPLVNAFALPGGFVYVTRGIMAHLESEAELVGILGHEIGHITARHGVNRLSKQQLAGIGLGIGMIVSPELRSVGDLAQSGLGLLFLKYSRDDERQSDDLGLRYALRSGYDPREIPAVFDLLQRVSQASGGGRVPGWLATHPDPGQRRERMAAQVAQLDVDLSETKVERLSYQRRLDGMVFGENPREGYFEDDTFYHPDLAFSLDFPSGWQRQNQKQAVIAVSEEKDAMLQMTLVEETEPSAAARELVSEDGIRSGPVERSRIGGHPAATVVFEIEREQSSDLGGRATFIRYGDRTYRILGLTMKEKYNGYRRAIEGSQSSFRKVTDRKVLDVQPRRLSMVDIERGLTLEEFERSFPSTVPLATLGLLNRPGPDGRLDPSVLAKRVLGGPDSR